MKNKIYSSTIVVVLFCTLVSVGSTSTTNAEAVVHQSQRTWSSARDVDPNAPSSAHAYDIVMNHGEAQAIYGRVRADVANYWELYQSTSNDNGQTFGSPSPRGCGNSAASSVPKVAESADGYVYVVWQAYECPSNSPRSLFINVRSPQGIWSGSHKITTYVTNGWSVAVGSDGVVHVSYSRYWEVNFDPPQPPAILDTQVQYVNSYNHESTFSIPTSITDRDTNKSTYIDWTSIAADTAGHPHIVFEQGANQYNFRVLARDFTTSWQSVVVVYDVPKALYPDAAANYQGGVGTVWQTQLPLQLRFRFLLGNWL